MAYTKHDKAFCAERIQGRFELDLITGAGCFIRANNDECRSSWFLERNALYYPANFPRANTWLVCTVNYTKVFPYRVTRNRVSLPSPLDTTLIPLSPSLNSDTIPPPSLDPIPVIRSAPISDFKFFLSKSTECLPKRGGRYTRFNISKAIARFVLRSSENWLGNELGWLPTSVSKITDNIKLHN